MKHQLRILLTGWLMAAMAVLPLQGPTVAAAAQMAAMDCCVVAAPSAGADGCGGCSMNEPIAGEASPVDGAADSPATPADEEDCEAPPCCRACCPTGLVAVLTTAAVVTDGPRIDGLALPGARPAGRSLEPVPPPPKA